MTIRLTKDALRELGIHNSYWLAETYGKCIFIEYVPADNGRLTARYAYWRFWNNRSYKAFDVTCRGNKQPKLKEAMAWGKEKHGIKEFERDPFGNYQVVGSLDKIMEIRKKKLGIA